MTGLIEVRVGDTVLLVEVAGSSGSELTSGRLNKASEHVLEAFDRAQAAIVDIAASTAHTIEQTAKRAARPDHLEVEFGVKFSVKGDLILAGAAGEANLKVKLVYDRASEQAE